MKKDALLDAAEALLWEQGTQALTLTAVADRAGVSKGGLLYHFPTKEALIRGLVARLIEEFDALIAVVRRPAARLVRARLCGGDLRGPQAGEARLPTGDGPTHGRGDRSRGSRRR